MINHDTSPPKNQAKQITRSKKLDKQHGIWYNKINQVFGEVLSQIGGAENTGNYPNKKVSMEKIFVNIDGDGDNSRSNHFHEKMAHRQVVMNKVNEYLNE